MCDLNSSLLQNKLRTFYFKVETVWHKNLLMLLLLHEVDTAIDAANHAGTALAHVWLNLVLSEAIATLVASKWDHDLCVWLITLLLLN